MFTTAIPTRFVKRFAQLLVVLVLLGSQPVLVSNPATAASSTAYATLTRVYDSLGNVTTHSWSSDGFSHWSCTPDCPDLFLNVGETITITAVASDPNNRPLEYQFWINTNEGGHEIVQAWSSNNTYIWNIAPRYYGKYINVIIAVRNDDGVDFQGEYQGDDYTYAAYEVLDPNHLPAYLISITDSLGNINTNSWARGNGGGWSCSPNCARLFIEVGETITITANAADPNGLPLEYLFAISTTKSGGINTLQNWSPNNAYHWTITPDLVGENAGIVVGVRNNDGMPFLSLSSDDYTNAMYFVSAHVYLPIIAR